MVWLKGNSTVVVVGLVVAAAAAVGVYSYALSYSFFLLSGIVPEYTSKQRNIFITKLKKT